MGSEARGIWRWDGDVHGRGYGLRPYPWQRSWLADALLADALLADGIHGDIETRESGEGRVGDLVSEGPVA